MMEGQVKADELSLDQLGLTEGEAVRWRRREGARWEQGTVIRRETDGSVAVHDRNGAWRSIPVERLEARVVTKRGAKRWSAVENLPPIVRDPTPEPDEDPAPDPELKLW